MSVRPSTPSLRVALPLVTGDLRQIQIMVLLHLVLPSSFSACLIYIFTRILLIFGFLMHICFEAVIPRSVICRIALCVANTAFALICDS